MQAGSAATRPQPNLPKPAGQRGAAPRPSRAFAQGLALSHASLFLCSWVLRANNGLRIYIYIFENVRGDLGVREMDELQSETF